MFLIKKSNVFMIIAVIFFIQYAKAENKYSEKANKPKSKTDFSYPVNLKGLRQLDNPFRMHKLNIVWTKAKHVSLIRKYI